MKLTAELLDALAHSNQTIVRARSAGPWVEAAAVVCYLHREIGRCKTEPDDGVPGSRMPHHVLERFADERQQTALAFGRERRGLPEGSELRLYRSE